MTWKKACERSPCNIAKRIERPGGQVVTWFCLPSGEIIKHFNWRRMRRKNRIVFVGDDLSHWQCRFHNDWKPLFLNGCVSMLVGS